MRVAAAALALSGAGLMITGVANAVTAPALAPGKIVNGPLDVPGAYAEVPTATDSAAASDPVTDPTGTDPATDPSTAPADPGSTAPADPGTSTPADPTTTGPADPTTGSAPVTATPGATRTSGTAAGGGQTGGSGMTQAPARQTLAETGADDSSVPFLLAGGFTLLAGGLVFRFGPRTAAPRHGV
ncbi:LPXTG cell wall anchor domain-containing protein [Streptacidiphilus sp. PAMC 29251]